MDKRLRTCLKKLTNACLRLGWDTDVWERGIDVLQRKFRVIISPPSFNPRSVIQMGSPAADMWITITPTEVDS